MELTNEFDVEVPIDEAYDILTDLELIAPCLPGAQLQEIEGDEYRGIVKVKVGPITAQYKGTATFLEQDRANHKAVVKGDGRETRGQGNASAIITMTMESNSPESTHVMVHTDLTITGKVAQFGRGVIVDVSAKLLGQFVDNLETKVLAGRESEAADAGGAAEASDADSAGDADAGAEAAAATAGAAANGATSAEGVRKIDAPEAEPVDLLDTAGSDVLKRAVPAGIIGVLLLLLIRRLLGSSDD